MAASEKNRGNFIIFFVALLSGVDGELFAQKFAEKSSIIDVRQGRHKYVSEC